MKTGELLNELAALMGEMDRLNAEMKAVKDARRGVEAALIKAAEAAGLDQLSNDTLSVTVKEDMIAAYDPDHWTDLVVWAAETGNSHVIQRRISTKPIKELIDNGEALPIGVRLEPQTKVLARRK